MSDYYQPPDSAWYEEQMKVLKQSHLPVTFSHLDAQTILNAIEDEHCQNSWRWLSSLSRQERQRLMADYEKSREVVDNYWKSASIDQKFDIWKDS